MHEIDAQTDGRGLRIGIVVARYNATITDGLLTGALDALTAAGVEDDDVILVRVPGALEIPVVVAHLARRAGCDAVIALGAVIEGETDHYTYVCAETMRGCGEVATTTGVPVGFGVLTCKTLLQARDRSSTPAKNKGREAALAVIEAAHACRTIDDLAADDGETT